MTATYAVHGRTDPFMTHPTHSTKHATKRSTKRWPRRADPHRDDVEGATRWLAVASAGWASYAPRAVEETPTSMLPRPMILRFAVPLQIAFALLLAMADAPAVGVRSESRELMLRSQAEVPATTSPVADEPRCALHEATPDGGDPLSASDADGTCLASRHTEDAKVLVSRLAEIRGDRSTSEYREYAAAPRAPPLRPGAAIS